MSRTIDLCNAVVTELNEGTFSLDFTATVRLLPEFKLEQLTDLVVSVLPTSPVEQERSDRSTVVEARTAQIGVQQRVQDDSDTESLIALAEEILDFMHERPLASLPGAVFFSAKIDPIYFPDHLDKYSVFTGVVAVTYQIAIES